MFLWIAKKEWETLSQGEDGTVSPGWGYPPFAAEQASCLSKLNPLCTPPTVPRPTHQDRSAQMLKSHSLNLILKRKCSSRSPSVSCPNHYLSSKFARKEHTVLHLGAILHPISSARTVQQWKNWSRELVVLQNSFSDSFFKTKSIHFPQRALLQTAPSKDHLAQCHNSSWDSCDVRDLEAAFRLLLPTSAL